MVERGKSPSRELIDQATGIARAWIDSWSITTGGRSSMTTTAK